MASVRNLKKDIDLIITLVINDCLFVLEQNDKVSDEAVLNIINDIIIKHRELRVRAKHPDGKENRVLVKKHYNSIIDDLLKAADSALEKLSAEVKKVV